MNVHRNAGLTPRGRAWIVERVASVQTPKAIAGRFANGWITIAAKDWRGCGLAPPGRAGYTDPCLR
jgi:hypothetical protein